MREIMTNETNRWMLIPPGGPQGPVYGVCARNGWMIAPQVANKHYANFLVRAGNAAQCDFDTIYEAGVKLQEIIKRDFPTLAESKRPVGL
jgi:hypothetical protein